MCQRSVVIKDLITTAELVDYDVFHSIPSERSEGSPTYEYTGIHYAHQPDPKTGRLSQS